MLLRLMSLFLSTAQKIQHQSEPVARCGCSQVREPLLLLMFGRQTDRPACIENNLFIALRPLRQEIQAMEKAKETPESEGGFISKYV